MDLRDRRVRLAVRPYAEGQRVRADIADAALSALHTRFRKHDSGHGLPVVQVWHGREGRGYDVTKRAQNGSGTIRKRADGRYEARIMIDGRIKAFYGRTHDEADAKLQDARKARRTGAPIVMPGRRTLGQYLAEWHEGRAFATHATQSQYAWAIAHITPSIGNVRLTFAQAARR